MSNSKDYLVVVEKVVMGGKHGPYVVSRSEELDVVTFSLDKEVWQEEHKPEAGDLVILSQVVMKRAGWRAKKARAKNPSDTTNSNSKQQGA